MNTTVFIKNDKYKDILNKLARQLEISAVNTKPTKSDDSLFLTYDDTGLHLEYDGLIIQGDFTHMLPRLNPSNLRNELLVKAAKFKKNDIGVPTVIDATAGLGDDSLILAAAGFSVKLFEYNPIIEALLQDAINRASIVPELSDIVQRMHASQADSIKELTKLNFKPDIILLDPMFPARQKSALVKKKFQLLQRLEHPCVDENELLQAAINACPRKIIIKRPAKGPHLAGIKPSYSIQGKSIRYDCIVLP